MSKTTNDHLEAKYKFQLQKEVDALETCGWQIFEGPYQVFVVHALTGKMMRFDNEHGDEKHPWVCHPYNRDHAIQLILEWSDR